MIEYTKLPKRILYVDASFNSQTKESKVSLYDVDRDHIETLVTSVPQSSSFAERYAIVYACLYTKKLNIIEQKIHILNDNFSATTHTKIKDLCQLLNISISWIPREINTIADKGTQNNCNVPIEDVYICDLFYEVMIQKNMAMLEKNSREIIEEKNDISVNVNEKNILLNALRHLKTKDKQNISLGAIGKYLHQNNPDFKYASIKKVLMKYPNDFTIMNNNFVKSQ